MFKKLKKLLFSVAVASYQLPSEDSIPYVNLLCTFHLLFSSQTLFSSDELAGKSAS